MRKIERFRIDGCEQQPINNDEQLAPFRVVKTFVNETPMNITVVTRNNVRAIIPKVKGYHSNDSCFIIRTIYYFTDKENIIMMSNLITDAVRTSKVINKELLILQESFTRIARSPHGFGYTHSVIIDRKIPLRKICHHQGLYIHEADIMILNPDNKEFTPHPYSDEGMMIDGIKEFTERSGVSGVFVEIVDNDNKISSRYMYVAKRLVEIKPKVDRDRKSGVYLTSAEIDFGGDVDIVPEFYSAEDAEDAAGIYKTAEDAISGGDPEILTRIQENRTKSELLDLKRTTDLERAAHDLDKLRMESKLRAMQEEIDENRARRNDFYENRSQVRKDAGEIWKYAAAICITGLSVYAATVKANSK